MKPHYIRIRIEHDNKIDWDLEEKKLRLRLLSEFDEILHLKYSYSKSFKCLDSGNRVLVYEVSVR